MGPCSSKQKQPQQKEKYEIKNDLPGAEQVPVHKPSARGSKLNIPVQNGKDDQTSQSKREENKSGYDIPKRRISKQKSRVLESSIFQNIPSLVKLINRQKDNIHIRTSTFSSDYTIIKQLGKGNNGIETIGGQGAVYLAQHNVNQIFRAVKVIKYDNKSHLHDTLTEELCVLQKLDHPNIVKVFDFYKDKKFCYMVIDYCSGGDLIDHLRQKAVEESKSNATSIQEKDILEVMGQLLRAVNYLHKNSIAHRDIKPENLLYASNSPNSLLKLIDFGISKTISREEQPNDTQGTLLYMSPEALRGEPSLMSDIWSCGVLFVFLITGRHPFDGKNKLSIQKSIQRGLTETKQVDLKEAIGNKLIFNLIIEMLHYNPKDRPSASKCLTFRCFSQIKPETPLSKTALENMRKFTSKAKLQQILLMYIVNLLAGSEEKDELTRAFQEMDLNNDGKLSKQELLKGYLAIQVNPAEAKAYVEKIFLQIDENANGEIDYSEFLMACIDKKMLLDESNLNRAFNSLDRDGSGSLSIKELKNQLSDQIQEDVWRELLSQLDTNHDQFVFYFSHGNFQISRKEFIRSMKALIKGTQ